MGPLNKPSSSSDIPSAEIASEENVSSESTSSESSESTSPESSSVAKGAWSGRTLSMSACPPIALFTQEAWSKLLATRSNAFDHDTLLSDWLLGPGATAGARRGAGVAVGDERRFLLLPALRLRPRAPAGLCSSSESGEPIELLAKVCDKRCAADDEGGGTGGDGSPRFGALAG